MAARESGKGIFLYCSTVELPILANFKFLRIYLVGRTVVTFQSLKFRFFAQYVVHSAGNGRSVGRWFRFAFVGGEARKEESLGHCAAPLSYEIRFRRKGEIDHSFVRSFLRVP